MVSGLRGVDLEESGQGIGFNDGRAMAKGKDTAEVGKELLYIQYLQMMNICRWSKRLPSFLWMDLLWRWARRQ